MMKTLLTILFLFISVNGQIKISELPSTSTLNGSDIFVVVNAGVTKKITLDNLAALLQPYFIPSGSILIVESGSCPLLFTEVSALDGKTLLGTLNGNGDVGTTGGNNNITPSGTNSTPLFTGDSVASNSISGGTPSGTNTTPTFTGTAFSDIINHTHIINITDTGHNHTQNPHSHVQNINSATNGGLNGYGVDTSTNTSSATGYSTANATATNIANTTGITASSNNPAGGVSSITPVGTISTPVFTGDILAGHSHNITATGSISTPTFTGNSFDNRSAFTKVIFCKKN